MKAFLKNLLFFVLGYLVLIIVGILIPPTPRASSSHIFAKLEKDELLKKVRSPRLILIGGSNISLSINSQILKDSLDRNPINTGISASIGLAYMLDNTLHYVRPKDIVIVSPEYSQFYDHLAYGTEDLLRTVLDVAPEEIFKLRGKQLWKMIKYVPKYAFSKFKLSEYSYEKDNNTIGIYERRSFNQYGDLYRHWGLGPKKITPLEPPSVYDHTVVDLLYEYKQKVEDKGATLYITFPAFHKASFENQIEEIATIEKELKYKGFVLLGNPERYKMPEDIMFDTPYHLTKEGVDFRTQLLIHDLKKTLLHNLAAPPLKTSSTGRKTN